MTRQRLSMLFKAVSWLSIAVVVVFSPAFLLPGLPDETIKTWISLLGSIVVSIVIYKAAVKLSS